MEPFFEFKDTDGKKMDSVLDLVVHYSPELGFLERTGGAPENPLDRKLTFRAIWDKNVAKLAPLPHLSAFCFPQGAKITDKKSEFQTHSFVLNLISGNVIYGFCSTFSVEISDQALAVAKWVSVIN
jgi:hypothetical protein